MTKFDLVIFDFDGTLCDTHEAITFCISKTFKQFDVDSPSLDKIFSTIKKGIDLFETIKELNPQLNQANIEEWITAYRKIYNSGIGLKHSMLFSGVKKMFKKLNQMGIALVVASNKGIKAVNLALEYHGLAPYVDLVVADDGKMVKKPNPESYFKKVKPQFPNITLERLLIVGDTKADIEFAQNIGSVSCWASYGYGESEQCRAMSPNFILEKPSDLVNICGEQLKNFEQEIEAKSSQKKVKVSILTSFEENIETANPEKIEILNCLKKFCNPKASKKVTQVQIEHLTVYLLQFYFESNQEENLTLVPIQRAGMAMWTAANKYFEFPLSSFVMCEKEKGTNRVSVFWLGGPPEQAKNLLILDTVSATGDTINAVCKVARQCLPNVKIEVLTCYASPEAIEKIKTANIADTLKVGVISETVDNAGFLIPKTNGDTGDKLYGSKGSFDLKSTAI